METSHIFSFLPHKPHKLQKIFSFFLWSLFKKLRISDPLLTLSSLFSFEKYKGKNLIMRNIKLSSQDPQQKIFSFSSLSDYLNYS